MEPEKKESLFSISGGDSALSKKSFVNPDADWLTFESCFNHDVYAKTHQQVHIGLFAIETQHVKVFVTRGMDKPTLSRLCEAFFPQFTPAELLQKACSDCDWQRDLKLEQMFMGLLSVDELNASRDENVIHLPTYAVLPYNFNDNRYDAITFGTKGQSEAGNTLWKLPKQWPMWHTTSRSCVVDISRVDPWPEKLAPIDYRWWYEEEDKDKQSKQANSHMTSGKLSMCFSMKTGVVKVGKTTMPKKHSVSTDITFGGVQSDYIAVINQKHGHSNNNDPHFRLLLEIFGIGERQQIGYGEGVVVRDLSCLSPKKRYLPAVSIPYIGTDITLLRERYACLDNLDWQAYWAKHFAKRLGRAKAIFLMRYGLQMETPNSQNYLIELDIIDGQFVPSGCILQRDLGDAQVIPNVFHALHIKKTIRVDANWTSDDFKNPDIAEMYPLLKKHTNENVALKWFTYSALTRGSQLTSNSMVSTDPYASKGEWWKVLCVMAQWGYEHAIGFIECVRANIMEACALDLSHYLEAFPDPKRFLELEKLATLDPSAASKAAVLLDEEFVLWEKNLEQALRDRVFNNHMVLASIGIWSWDVEEPKEPKEDEEKTDQESTTASSSTSQTQKPHENQDDPPRDESDWD